MKLRFESTDLAYSAERIADFLTLHRKVPGETFSGMAQSILSLYPEIDRDEIPALSETEIAAYVEHRLKDTYASVQQDLLEKPAQYQAIWDDSEKEIGQAYADIFQTDTENHFGGMVCRVNLNPICPRFLEDHSFDIFYQYSGLGARYVALHEITHFVWFDVWRRVFADGPEGYEQPRLPWIVSELAIDAILTDPRLNKFIAHEGLRNQPAYPEFYEIQTSEGSLIDLVRQAYRSVSIEEFMKYAYALCGRNRAAFTPHFGESD